ncbi:MAG: hypothetical protein GY703_20130 [Gammaproteobacteria bacterium]|nr:hypothetical protein [Gammaproteobacteria bacterium]
MVSTVSCNLMLIGGVSTLFFNGNPLLRFDAYYVLADAIEIPNLSSRGEKAWFVVYGGLAYIYRLVILGVIIVFVGSQFFFIGVLIALWSVFTMVVPVGKYLDFLMNSPRLARTRSRSIFVGATLVVTLLALLFLVPTPLRSTVEGVVWLPEHARVRVGTDCFVERMIAVVRPR